MSASDPEPPSAPLRRRSVRILRLAALFAIALAAIAVAMVVRGGDNPHIHLLLATALGVGLAVLLGTAAMTLYFLGKDQHDPRL